MAREKLDTLMRLVASSLATANDELVQGARQGMGYMVTEIEISVPYSQIDVEDGGIVVDTGKPEGEPAAEQFVRFKVLPFPQTLQEAKPEVDKPQPIPDLRRQRLEDSIAVLESAGFALENVRIAYNPRSRAPAGTVLQTEVKGVPALSDRGQIILTVAGKPPESEEQSQPDPKLENKPGDQPERRETPAPAPRRRRTRKKKEEED